MDVVADFVQAYEREMDFYEAAARLARQHLENALRSNGIKAITTSRAKRPESLEAKLRKRVADGSRYANVVEIREHLADLAGVRVALYFPRERERVNKLITSLFFAAAPAKDMPDKIDDVRKGIATNDGAVYRKRFDGYMATHHRVRLQDEQVPVEDKRLTTARIEIQVASALMHAWSEVEHDLIYKPLSGRLSTDEHAILDEINGLVISSEIALERLQAARDRRLQTQQGKFDSQYELASYLFEHVRRLFDQRVEDETMGRADWLFALLEKTGLNSRDKLESFLEELRPDFEQRPIAEQVIDKIVAGDRNRYEILQSIQHTEAEPQMHRALGRFLQHWIKLEEVLAWLGQPTVALASSDTPPLRHRIPSRRNLMALGSEIDPQVIDAYDSLRQLRNAVVHGALGEPQPGALDKAATDVDAVLQMLTRSSNPRVREIAAEALGSLGIPIELPKSSNNLS